jgi:hypothetical protein
MSSEDKTSCGSFQTEEDSVSKLNELLNVGNFFRIYQEVKGELLHPRPRAVLKKLRIDFILVPNQELVSAGWPHGPIGIECKKSGVKINEPLAQVLDYSRSCWFLPKGFTIICQYFFLWPYIKSHGTVASIMAQNRVGTVEEYNTKYGHLLKFYTGEDRILTIDLNNKSIAVGKCESGKKTGSR